MAILSERMANRWVFGLERGRCRTSYNAIIAILLEQYPFIRTQSSLSKWRGKCSDRVRIFQELYKYLIYIGNFMEPNLAKVGVEGSNPFARSSFPRKINGLQNHFPTGCADFAVFGFFSGHRQCPNSAEQDQDPQDQKDV